MPFWNKPPFFEEISERCSCKAVPGRTPFFTIGSATSVGCWRIVFRSRYWFDPLQPDSPFASRFSTCHRCRLLSAPRCHTPREWPADPRPPRSSGLSHPANLARAETWTLEWRQPIEGPALRLRLLSNTPLMMWYWMIKLVIIESWFK